jgi:futalosine hydrolase
MSLKVLYVSATSTEADILKEIEGIKYGPDGYFVGNIEIRQLVTGVGSVSTAWAINKWLSANERPDLAINAGIAGSYNKELEIGDVVMPVSDCFADAGIEDGDNFLTLDEAGLVSANEFPFTEGNLVADNRYTLLMKGLLKPVRAITVNTATGSDATREKLLKKYNPDIETMEGATFFYTFARENIPFLALRAISNKVEIRNKNNWNIPLAIQNLSGRFNEVIKRLK